MKKLIFCAVGVAMFSNVANAAMCKDFDDDMNLVEYECGTSLSAAIKANKAKEEAEKKAKEDAEKLEKERIAAEKKAKEDAEKLEKERIAAEKKAKEDAKKLEKERIAAEKKAKKLEKERIAAEKKTKEDAERKRLKAELQSANVSISVWDAVYWKWLHFDPFVGFGIQHIVEKQKYRMDDGTFITNPFPYGNFFQLGLMVSSGYSDEFLFIRYEIGSFGEPNKHHEEYVPNAGPNDRMCYNTEGQIQSIDFGYGTKLYKSFNGYAGFGIGYHNSSFHITYNVFNIGNAEYPQGWVDHYDKHIRYGAISEKMFVGLEYKLFNWLRVYTEPTIVVSHVLTNPSFYVPLGARIVF